jgi:hypothetical protein
MLFTTACVDQHRTDLLLLLLLLLLLQDHGHQPRQPSAQHQAAATRL